MSKIKSVAAAALAVALCASGSEARPPALSVSVVPVYQNPRRSGLSPSAALRFWFGERGGEVL